jgi:hypothetical protein
MLVMVSFVLAQEPAQVGLVPDQGSVQELGLNSSAGQTGRSARRPAGASGGVGLPATGRLVRPRPRMDAAGQRGRSRP